MGILDDVRLFKNKFTSQAIVDNYLNEGKAHITKDDWAQLLYTCLQANKLTDAVKLLRGTRYSLVHCSNTTYTADTTEIPVSELIHYFMDEEADTTLKPDGITIICANGNVYVSEDWANEEQTALTVTYLYNFEGPRGTGLDRTATIVAVGPDTWQSDANILPYTQKSTISSAVSKSPKAIESTPVVSLSADVATLSKYGIVIGAVTDSGAAYDITFYSLIKPANTLYLKVIVEDLING